MESRTQSWSVLTQYPMYDLKPERTNSVEVGMNLKLINDISFDATFYLANTANQTFNPQPAREPVFQDIHTDRFGYGNWGMEFALSLPARMGRLLLAFRTDLFVQPDQSDRTRRQRREPG